jgi:hypothetical protein
MARDYRPGRLSLPKTISARGDGVAHRGWGWRRRHRSAQLGSAAGRPCRAPGIRLPRSVARAARGAASSRDSWDHPGLHRQQALALHFLARELAGAADSFRLLPRLLFRGFLVTAAELLVADRARSRCDRDRAGISPERARACNVRLGRCFPAHASTRSGRGLTSPTPAFGCSR